MEQEREVLTWADFDRSIWDLAERVAADGVPDMILSIARGGHDNDCMLRSAGW